MITNVDGIVIDILEKNGYAGLISKIFNSLEDINIKVSEIPIPPAMIEDNKVEIIFNKTVERKYQSMLKMINNLKLAKEYPFVLLGNKREINGVTTIVFSEVVNRHTNPSRLNPDYKKLKDVVKKNNNEIIDGCIQTDNYNVIAIGHAHPMLGAMAKDRAITSKIPVEIKNEYEIKEVGSNVSIRDIVEYEAIQTEKNKMLVSNNKELLQIIIMYSGEVVALSLTDGNITKTNNIIAIKDNKMEYVIPTTEYKGENSLMKQKKI